jgi:transposase InsO family protein
MGCVHVDITELRTGQGKHYLFVAVDKSTKYVYAGPHDRMTTAHALTFLRHPNQYCAFKITHILADNGAQFTYNLLAKHLRPKHAEHPFDAVCQQLGIGHRTTQFRHPWTNGQVEITNKTIKQATTKQFHYTNASELKTHLMTFLLYYNHQRPLKALSFKNPLASH